MSNEIYTGDPNEARYNAMMSRIEAEEKFVKEFVALLVRWRVKTGWLDDLLNFVGKEEVDRMIQEEQDKLDNSPQEPER